VLTTAATVLLLIAATWLGWRLLLWLGIFLLDVFISLLRAGASIAGWPDPLRNSLHPRR
jgi:hypothetical protein